MGRRDLIKCNRARAFGAPSVFARGDVCVNRSHRCSTDFILGKRTCVINKSLKSGHDGRLFDCGIRAGR